MNRCKLCDLPTMGTVYKYKDDKYCPDCLLQTLEKNGTIFSTEVKRYYFNGHFLGDDFNKDDHEIIGELQEYLNIESEEK